MPKFYFTYGTEGHPFFGGWTEVEAPDFESACSVFRMYHPNKIEPLLNCCTVYTEENFKDHLHDRDRGGRKGLCQ